MEGQVEKKKNWFARHKVLTAILIVVGIGIIGSSGNKSGQTTNTSQPATTSASATPEPAKEIAYETVDTKAFIAEFDGNQLSAEEKYKDKHIEFKGVIKNISEDIDGTPYLSLEPLAAGQYYVGTSIKCSFKDKAAVMNVKNKQTVTLRGKVNTQSLGIITINECSIVE